jgi:hypothetical protein
MRLRVPNMFNLHADPFERGTESQFHSDWLAHRIFLIFPTQAITTQWHERFREFPPLVP